MFDEWSHNYGIVLDSMLTLLKSCNFLSCICWLILTDSLWIKSVSEMGWMIPVANCPYTLKDCCFDYWWFLYKVYEQIWERGQLCAKHDIFFAFQLATVPSQWEIPGFTTWFVSRSALLLHRSDVRSYNEPPVSNGNFPKWGIRLFSNVIDAHAHPIVSVQG